MKRTDRFARLRAEFRELALRGSFVDLAVGVIVGGAFGKISTSLAGDVIMPAIGVLLGGVDFSTFNITLPALWTGGAPVQLGLGNFLRTVVDFFLIALCVFFLVKCINALRRREAAEEPPPPPAPDSTALLTEIRDLLKQLTVDT
ncbi:MAG: large-conductance mechanosensitive channel protein MscL [Oscillospiraceae bacterium]|jgi:large conductance mechanosensitive channel|nr:large-conductance mechanosensitive channel protein MscL [Oscillospiraceae bacterium]